MTTPVSLHPRVYPQFSRLSKSTNPSANEFIPVYHLLLRTCFPKLFRAPGFINDFPVFELLFHDVPVMIFEGKTPNDLPVDLPSDLRSLSCIHTSGRVRELTALCPFPVIYAPTAFGPKRHIERIPTSGDANESNDAHDSLCDIVEDGIEILRVAEEINQSVDALVETE